MAELRELVSAIAAVELPKIYVAWPEASAVVEAVKEAAACGEELRQQLAGLAETWGQG